MKAYSRECKEKHEIDNSIMNINIHSEANKSRECSAYDTGVCCWGYSYAPKGMSISEIIPVTGKNNKSHKNKEQCNGKMVIVESPAKARTVGNFLGEGYTVRASVGHVRDLLRSQLSVDVENDFEPRYRVPNEKRKIVKELKEEASHAEEIYLATDPDREGEAIAWHLIEAAELDRPKIKRVVFHEITKPAIDEAFSHPREIDENLVNAQQARRILDRLVGYNLTPLLWEKVRNRLSAGRVQSVALRLIVEREREIKAFIPEEYWTIDAEFAQENDGKSFIAHLVKIDKEDPSLPSQSAVEDLTADLEKSSYKVSKIKRGTRIRNSYPPFTTSTMQQQASRQLGYTTKRTMQIAQQLYEGIDVGDGSETGLITYMRTDSTLVSPLAIDEVRRFIPEAYGSSYLPERANIYKTKSAQAQEAHEAVRPTSVFRTPEQIKKYLTPDQFKLYQLIWRRFVASQMAPAVYDTLSIEIIGKGSLHEYLFRASGSKLQFQGFLILYEEAKDEDDKNEDEILDIPAGLEDGDGLHLMRLLPEQHFTQPPPRYTEASLVKALEEHGIGRPSTYAPIVSTIQTRGYVEKENKHLVPTETGFVVIDLLVEYFPDVLGVDFTAHMEEDLDAVAGGKREWRKVVREFYNSFEPKLKYAQANMPKTTPEAEKVDKPCPECGGELVVKWGRHGRFIGCSNYPTCKHTEPYLEKIGVQCPKDGGDIVLRKSRKGRIFYGCCNYPNCDFTSWKRPINARCPNCGGLLAIKNKNEYQCLACEESFPVESIEVKETA